MKLAVALAAALIAMPMQAAAVTPWTQPGNNPCGDLCPEDWAIKEMRDAGVLTVDMLEALETAELQPYMVITGDVILAMTYAKQGIPYLDTSIRIADFEDGAVYPGYGYPLDTLQGRYWLVRINYCGNWALIRPDAWYVQPPEPLVIPPYVYASPVSFVGASPGGFVGVGGVGFCCIERDVDRPSVQPPDRPEVIPLPGTVYMLLSALAALVGLSVTRRS